MHLEVSYKWVMLCTYLIFNSHTYLSSISIFFFFFQILQLNLGPTVYIANGEFEKKMDKRWRNNMSLIKKENFFKD